MLDFVIGLAFLAAFCLALALFTLGGRRWTALRLRRLGGDDHALLETSVENDERSSMLFRLTEPFAGRAAHSDSQKITVLRERLVHAGFRRPSAVVIFMGSRVLLAAGLALSTLLYPLPFGLADVRFLALMLGAAGLGYVLPSYFVDTRKRSRQDQIDRGLPDALDLMVVCVEAGLGMNAGLTRVAQELAHSTPVLSRELALVNLEVRAGKSTTQALRALADRTGVSDISALVAMLIQTERFGTRLADTLRVQADAMRVQRIQRAEEAAQKAPLKMLFPTGTLIFPATLAMAIGPGLMQLFKWFSDNS